MPVVLIGVASEQSLIPSHPGFRHGMIWGIAGFIALQLAPSFGLAPEVPGSTSANLESRQIWWFATTLATSLACWIFAFAQNRLVLGMGIVLLLAPHMIGAP